MSDQRGYEPWGPSHQHERLPARRKRIWPWLLIGWPVLLSMLSTHGDVIAAFMAVVGSLGRPVVLAFCCWLCFKAWRKGHLARLHRVLLAYAEHRHHQEQQGRAQISAALPANSAPSAATVGAQARRRVLAAGGGAYLGRYRDGDWAIANAEHAALALGPPRSWKTGGVVIPSILCAPGPVVSTATKPDVLSATRHARSEIGQTWHFDLSGAGQAPPDGMRALRWSPISAARTWDQALLTARAMSAAAQTGRGTTNEDHWRERATALLAPLLHAAHLSGEPITSVLTWVLRGELDAPAKRLEEHNVQSACDVLAGIAKTEARERSSIFSATAGTLAAYNTDAARANAAETNFDPESFPRSTDTIYITAPAHQQALCAPLVVGLLEQIRYATFEHATRPDANRYPPVFFCLDELANIAPIHDLPALLSEAGGQRLHILACLQDLSQARKRWGSETADGLLTLFQTKLILKGIADPRTLEAISTVLGEYDRQTASHTLGDTADREAKSGYKHSESVTHNTQRQRILSPGEIAAPPDGHALLLQGLKWELIQTTPWYNTAPWAQIAAERRPRTASQ